jgi:hypothetical protein
MEDLQRQHRAALRAAQFESATLVSDVQRPEDPKLHMPNVTPCRKAQKTRMGRMSAVSVAGRKGQTGR